MTSPSFRARLSVLLCCALAVQGCTGGMSQVFQPKEATASEQVVIPQPAPAVSAQTVSTSTASTAPATRSAMTLAKRENIALNVLYLERILVPVGSDLIVRAEGDGSGPPSVKSTKVQSGPPYDVSLPVDTGEGAYPMTVQATLTSTIGHVLSGSVTLTEKPNGPVEIIMQTTSQ